MKRTEIRQQITESAGKIKNNIILNEILQISELMRRTMDEKEYMEVSEPEWDKRVLIRAVLNMDDPRRIRNLRAIADGMERRSRGICKT